MHNYFVPSYMLRDINAVSQNHSDIEWAYIVKQPLQSNIKVLCQFTVDLLIFIHIKAYVYICLTLLIHHVCMITLCSFTC